MKAKLAAMHIVARSVGSLELIRNGQQLFTRIQKAGEERAISEFLNFASHGMLPFPNNICLFVLNVHM